MYDVKYTKYTQLKILYLNMPPNDLNPRISEFPKHASWHINTPLPTWQQRLFNLVHKGHLINTHLLPK